MKVLCSICHDLLIPAEDIFFVPCGHVFHLHCLLHWLAISDTCPQCREHVTEDRIHKVHFTFSGTETAADNADNADNLSLQGKIDSLKFQILLNEKNISHYTSKNATLERQNAGLRQEVRKVESEISQKNSTIHALEEQLKCFKEKSLMNDILKHDLKKSDRKCLRHICKMLPESTVEDIQKLIREMTDQKILTDHISAMTKIMYKRTAKIRSLRDQLTMYRDSLTKKQSEIVGFKKHLAFYERENLSLLDQVNELKNLHKITSEQNCVAKSNELENLLKIASEQDCVATSNEVANLLNIASEQKFVAKSNSRRNSNEIPKYVERIDPKVALKYLQCTFIDDLMDICDQEINTKQETADQNGPSSSEVETTDANQENSMHTSTFNPLFECPFIKKPRLVKVCDQVTVPIRQNDVTTTDKNTAGTSLQSK